MNDYERIKAMQDLFGLNLSQLANEIGIKTVQTFYDIKNGKHGISKDLADKIQARYLNVNKGWLLTGEGSMLRGDVATRTCQNGCGTSVTATNNSQAAGGNIVTHLAPNGEDGARAFLEEIAAHRRMVEKAQEQTDRLLTIIERLTGGEKTI